MSLHLSPEVDTVRLATVLQENAVLKSELEIIRLKCKSLLEENRRLRQASVNIVSPQCHRIQPSYVVLPEHCHV